LKEFNYADDTKFYYGNVDTLIAPSSTTNTEYYPILDVDNNEYYRQSGAVKGAILDPISIRFKETEHIILPLKWKFNSSTLLPRLYEESEINLESIYGTIAKDYFINGSKPYQTQVFRYYWSINSSISENDLICNVGDI